MGVKKRGKTFFDKAKDGIDKQTENLKKMITGTYPGNHANRLSL
jgi:hypothetical protein